MQFQKHLVVVHALDLGLAGQGAALLEAQAAVVGQAALVAGQDKDDGLLVAVGPGKFQGGGGQALAGTLSPEARPDVGGELADVVHGGRIVDKGLDDLETDVIDEGLNVGIPAAATGLYNRVKKLQSGVLSYNIIYMIIIFLVLILGLVSWSMLGGK